jgi:uncharacterized repeat protein (TIGR01451 family)
MRRQYVRRWGVGLVATVALTGFGLLYANETLLAGAMIPLAYVLYGALSGLPDDVELAVDRTLTSETPTPGQRVGVTLTVQNTGDDVLPDVRLIDGVPDELAVVEGSPRLCAPLSPGESETISYRVVAKRGTFSFDSPVVRLRSLAGVDRLTTDIEAEGDRTITCVNTVENLPATETPTPQAGIRPTDSGGSGLEFYATREYKHGDPVNRIDWHHVAKTGEFITIQYREERASTTVLVLDARPVTRVTRAPGYPTGVELVAYVGERLYEALDEAGFHTSLTAMGLDEGTHDDEFFEDVLDPDGLMWMDADGTTGRGRPHQLFEALRRVADAESGQVDIAPPILDWASSGGPDTRIRQRDRQTTRGSDGEETRNGPAQNRPTAGQQRAHGSSVRGRQNADARTDGGERTERLLARLPPDAQVVVCTPLLDNWPVSLVRELLGRDYDPFVVSPDAVSGVTPGKRLAASTRQLRLTAMERAGVETVSWQVEQPIEHALRRSLPQLLDQ